MEFGYDLAIRPSVNVSENPGFETIAGLFESSGQWAKMRMGLTGVFVRVVRSVCVKGSVRVQCFDRQSS